MRKMLCFVVIALVIACYGEAHASDMNVIMPFRAAKLSHYDGTFVDDKKTIGQMLDKFKNAYCRKITYDDIKKGDGSVTILVGCIVDFDKFSYASHLKGKYQDIKLVMAFTQQGAYIFPAGQGAYTTDAKGVAAGGMQWSLVSAQEAADKLVGKAVYVADYELHKIYGKADK